MIEHEGPIEHEPTQPPLDKKKQARDNPGHTRTRVVAELDRAHDLQSPQDRANADDLAQRLGALASWLHDDLQQELAASLMNLRALEASGPFAEELERSLGRSIALLRLLTDHLQQGRLPTPAQLDEESPDDR